MKLGIISDIHANYANLERAILLLREREAELILCAGDLVDGESEGNAVVDYVRANDIPTVQGNHDLAISHSSATTWLERWEKLTLGTMPSCYREDIVSDRNRAFLNKLPLTRLFKLEGKRVLLAHATLWDQITYVFANGRREHIYRIAFDADADVVILGHTHQPMAVSVEAMSIFNPGSVDANRYDARQPTCALLDLPSMAYQVYDVASGQSIQYLRMLFS